MINLTVYARGNAHDAAIKRIRKEMTKDYPWEGHKTTAETAYKRVCARLGYEFIRYTERVGMQNAQCIIAVD